MSAADQGVRAGGRFSSSQMAEVGRALRFLNIALGAWIALAPWLLAGASPAGRLSGLLAGCLLVALSIPRGTIRERYGRWQRYVR